jgi:DNA (cytosine-5)-methyltransferase 1
METIRLFEAFAGYGSQLMSLRRLEKEFTDKIKIVPVGISEIDPHAIKSYQAVHGDVTNYGDISKIDWSMVPDFDLFTYSSPCQDFSNAGKQSGGEEGSGTRSSLLWECRRAILAKKPKYLLMENVAALVQAKFIKLFNKWQLELESYGYKNFAKVLNAKNYNVPQNRERIFMVSILDENAKFEFPQPTPLTRKLKDVLEKDVDERYYLSEERLQGLKISTQKEKDAGRGFAFKPKNENDELANSITTAAGGRKTDNFIKTVGNLYDDSNGGKAAGIVIDDRGGAV